MAKVKKNLDFFVPTLIVIALLIAMLHFKQYTSPELIYEASELGVIAISTGKCIL